MVRAWLAVLAVLMGMGISFAASQRLPSQTIKDGSRRGRSWPKARPPKRRRTFEKLLAEYPNEADLHLFLGMSLLRLRDPQRGGGCG